jgi:predicted ABC-type transport system involved in lysophospholipase L1 biosynthesis ATPase subunit
MQNPRGTAETVVRATDVVRSYGTAASEVQALRGVSFEVRRGERVALLGKSGSGKSTLLHLLAGLDRPSRGRISIDDCELSSLSSRDLAAYRLTRIGMIFQAFNLIASKTALENVELPLVFAGVGRRQRQCRATEALDAVGLAQRVHHRPAELSGGEQQRVAIARALVNQPDLVLADEPTGNLDSDTSAGIIQVLMMHLDRHGSTLLMVTHDEELAQRCADRTLRLRDGRLDGEVSRQWAVGSDQ